MKALSLTQPWATLIAISAKHIETRSWRTSYRGPLAIHAAKKFPPFERRLLALEEPFRSAFLAAGYRIGALKNPNWIPLGAIVAVCTLVACEQIPEIPRSFQIAPGKYFTLPPYEDKHELAFGDYTPGRFGWILANIRALAEPIPAKGALGLWDWNVQLSTDLRLAKQ